MKTTRISNPRVFLAAAVLSFACLTAFAQDYRILHHFAGGTADGSTPLGSLALSGSTLYGMAKLGGSYGNGVIFSIDITGAGFQLLRSLDSAGGDGQNPYGSLIISGSDLYGMVSTEISGYTGTTFRIGTNGANWQLLRRFSGTDGKWPYGDLIQSGGMLYGLNTYGGSDTGSGWVGNGTLFQISTNGTGFQLLHSFAGRADGSGPHGSLIQAGSTLYGMTGAAGNGGNGTIFRINTNSTGYQILHQFLGGAGDGAGPGGTLLQSDSVLYGMTRLGGTATNGTVFRINTDGTGFQVLHSFTAASNDGSQPFGSSLVQSGSTLYGMTSGGGVGGNGVVFRMNTNGTAFQVLHSFNGSDGRVPMGSLTLSGRHFTG